jgi:16S rRNA (guanine966-N2)-methyltransferase
MRITGGEAARRHVKVPKGLDVRPTPDRVKQAVFNSLGERVADARVLELFAGSGALSLECLSRRAKSAICVEKSARHAEFIRRNVLAAGLDAASCQVRVQDVFAAVRQMAGEGMQYDLILADPPYGEKNVGKRSVSLAQLTLDEPAVVRLLAPDGLLVLGHARRDTLEVPSHWHEKRVLKHGDNVMRFLGVADRQGERCDATDAH